MTDLTIDRLSASVRAEPHDIRLRSRVDRLLRHVATDRLGSACASVAPADGDWCIQRLDVPLRIDLDRPDAALEAQWTQGLTEALMAAVGGRWRPGTDAEPVVLHYPRRVDAVADLLCGLASGRLDRLWAWRQVGLIAAAERPTPEAALRALMGEPTTIMTALGVAVASVGTDPLHRLLGSAGWVKLAEAVWLILGGPAGHLATIRIEPDPWARRGPVAPDSANRSGVTADPRSCAEGAGRGVVTPDPAAVRRVIDRSSLAGRFRSGRVRVDAPTCAAWAVLAVAQVEPEMIGRTMATGIVAGVAAAFRPVDLVPTSGSERAATGPAGPLVDEVERGPEPWTPKGPKVLTGPVKDGSAGAPEADEDTDGDLEYESLTSGDPASAIDPAAPPRLPDPHDVGELVSGATAPACRVDDPDERDGGDPIVRQSWPTAAAGLLFLLGVAAEVGIPTRVEDHPDLGRRPLAFNLFDLGRRFAPWADPLDAAMFGFAGLVPADERPGRPPSDAQMDALDHIAVDWARVTVGRLRPTAAGASAVLRWLVERPGEVYVGPGWIEVVLPIDAVDTDVRRAGLDLDPGFVRMLGSVVRFRYA